MRIVFMGSPDFAIPSLERIQASAHEIIAVVSNRDKRRGRGKSTSPTPVKAKAIELELPVIEAEHLDAEDFNNALNECDADLFVVVAFRILPSNVLNIPRKGSVNLHASLLPKYRGAAPIHRAIMNGEEKTGCSVFFLDEHVDTGRIIKQKETPIGENETTGEVYDRLKNMGSHLLLEAIEEIASDTYRLIEQNDNKATSAPKLFTEDCRLDFQKTTRKIHNNIRGLSPFPTAWAELDGLKFNIYRSKIGPKDTLKPGQIVLKDGQMLAGSKDGSVILEEVQIEGKHKMAGMDFMNGYSGLGIIR